MVKKSMMALYGNTSIERLFCQECQSWSFIRDGKFVCCNSPTEARPQRYVRFSSSQVKRKTPSQKEKARILAEQDGCCLYCGVRFGETIHRNGIPVVVRLNWDHMLPYSFTQNNKATNFAAACHVCNAIKSDFVFETLTQAQKYIADKRRIKGYIV